MNNLTRKESTDNCNKIIEQYKNDLYYEMIHLWANSLVFLIGIIVLVLNIGLFYYNLSSNGIIYLPLIFSALLICGILFQLKKIRIIKNQQKKLLINFQKNLELNKHIVKFYKDDIVIVIGLDPTNLHTIESVDYENDLIYTIGNQIYKFDDISLSDETFKKII